MKSFAILALALSFSAQASTCFTRTTEIMYNEVRLGTTLCFEKAELDLNYFEDSYASIRYTVDGKPAFKRAKLKGKFNDAGNLEVKIAVEKNEDGGACDRFVGATSNLILEVSKDGSKTSFKKVTGEVLYSDDQCHFSTDVVQSFEYEAI